MSTLSLSRRVWRSVPATAGFTLLEIMTVIVIISLLAAAILASTNQARNKARITKATGDVKALRDAVAFLESDVNAWPNHLSIDQIGSSISGNELWDLTTGVAGLMQTDGSYNRWNGPYIKTLTQDPWGSNYFFDPDYDIDPGAGQTWAAVVGSFGPNKVGQNIYDADNIYRVISVQ